MNTAVSDCSTSEKLSQRLRWNSASGVFRFAILTLIYFLTYPYMLNTLGPQRFGMWALALVVSQSLGTQDLGIAGALIRFIPEYWNSNRKIRIQELASTAIFLLSGMGITIGLCVLLLRHWLVTLLKVPFPLQDEMAWLLPGMSLVFFFSLVSSGLTAILVGIHRMDVSNTVYTAAAMIQAGGVFFVLSRGYGLAGLTVNAMLTAFLWGSSTWFLLYRFLPGFRLRPSLAGRADAVSLLRYGLNIQAAGVGAFLTVSPIKVLLSRYVSLASVSSFELASGMAMQLRSGFVVAAMPLTPASAHLDSERASARIAQLYRQSLRYLVLVALPVFSLAVVLAPGFTTFWLHRQTPHVASTLGLLLVGWFFNTLTLPAYFILQGQGLARYQMYFTALQASSSILLGYALVRLGGYYGAICGLAIGLSIAAAYLLWQYPVLFRKSRGSLFDGSLLRAVAINVTLLAAFLLIPEWRQTSHFLGLLLLTISYLAAYLLLLVALGGLSESERRVVVSIWPLNILRMLLKSKMNSKTFQQQEQSSGAPATKWSER